MLLASGHILEEDKELWGVFLVSSCPRQADQRSCGLFVIAFIEAMALDMDVGSICLNMDSYYRKKLLYSVLTNQLRF